jgi:hypothetical protein
MKRKMISMKRFIGSVLALVIMLGASISAGAADSAPACKSGDCCTLCPRTSKAADTKADPKSANGVTLDPKLFVGPVRQAYSIAEQNPMLLKQLDCYCGCYKTDGHKSLLDCYRSRHGATCQICTNEVLDASRMFDSGMTPEQIKQSLQRKYQTAN